MNIQEHVALNTFSTFMVGAHARYFVAISSAEEFLTLIETDVYKKNPSYILGQGSNTLFASDYDGLLIHNQIKGLEVVSEDDKRITIEVGAGENWHDLVLWSLDQNLWGFENLVLIPGTVGASPVQNIGAYGAEVSQTVTQVRAIDTQTGDERVFSNSECKFSYRESIFKKEPGRYFITHVRFTLHKQGTAILSYDRVQEELEKRGLHKERPQDLAQAIIAIRDSKLPRVGELGTAGSFFKNPVVPVQKAQELKEQYPEMVQYPVDDNNTKLSAAWLIDYLGYKGKQEGSVGTYEKHALVLVNHGGAQGTELWNFAQKIIADVEEHFGVSLEAEVQIIGL